MLTRNIAITSQLLEYHMIRAYSQFRENTSRLPENHIWFKVSRNIANKKKIAATEEPYGSCLLAISKNK